MKKIIAALLCAALVLAVGGCSGKPDTDGLISSEQNILSREDEEPIVPETEYPAPDEPGELGEPSSASEAEPSPSSRPEASGEEAGPPASSSSAAPPAPESEAAPESSAAESEEEEPEPPAAPAVSGEVRAVWLSYLDLAPMLSGRSQSQFQSSIGAAFDDCAGLGLNTVFVQVRPFGDALYDSAYFPWSYLVSAGKTEGEDPGYDPLAVMVRAAHARGLRIEAWLNPYRIRTSGSKVALSADNPAARWLDEGGDYVVEYQGGVYYNPAREEVQNLIVKGVREIVEHYDVDGIHFDDYFYPSPDDSFDEDAYGEYVSGGGSKSLGAWRRANVDTLVKKVYGAVKAVRGSCKFGISPTGNHSNNYNLQYADVEKWCASSGYVDYICPQIYWGFESRAAPFQKTLESWEAIIGSSGVQLYVGLAAYKVGTQENDFASETDVMMRQVLASREQGHYGGFALYRYDSLFNPSSGVKSQVSREIKNLKSIF